MSDIPFAELPAELRTLSEKLKENPQVSQQLQMEIASANKALYQTLKRMLGASEVVTRLVISKEDPEGIDREMFSRLPDNIKICPNPNCTYEDKPYEMDALPPIIDLDNLPPTKCPHCKTPLIWKASKPPLTDLGINQISGMVMSKISNLVQLSYIPEGESTDIQDTAISFAEDVVKSIYDNDDWVENPISFMSAAYDYTLEDTIITNVQFAYYRAKGQLVNKLLEKWEVRQDIPLQQQQSKSGALNKLTGWIRG